MDGREDVLLTCSCSQLGLGSGPALRGGLGVSPGGTERFQAVLLRSLSQEPGSGAPGPGVLVGVGLEIPGGGDGGASSCLATTSHR